MTETGSRASKPSRLYKATVCYEIPIGAAGLLESCVPEPELVPLPAIFGQRREQLEDVPQPLVVLLEALLEKDLQFREVP